MRWIAGLVLLLLVGFAGIYIASGRAAPPGLVINQPSGRFIGQTGALDVIAEAPNAAFSALTITLEQNGRTIPVFALGDLSQAQVLTPVDRNHVRINQPIGDNVTGIKLAYAGPGTADPYAGFEARIVPENITLLPKTTSQTTGGNAFNEKQIVAKKGETVGSILRDLGTTQEDIIALNKILGPRGFY